MNPLHPGAFAAILLSSTLLSANAQPTVSPGKSSEPEVKHVVVEDEGARIEELRVRGVTRRIKVQPKAAGSASYEIMPLDAGREMVSSVQSERGTSGQRVWHVLSF